MLRSFETCIINIHKLSTMHKTSQKNHDASPEPPRKIQTPRNLETAFRQRPTHQKGSMALLMPWATAVKIRGGEFHRSNRIKCQKHFKSTCQRSRYLHHISALVVLWIQKSRVLPLSTNIGLGPGTTTWVLPLRMNRLQVLIDALWGERCLTTHWKPIYDKKRLSTERLKKEKKN